MSRNGHFPKAGPQAMIQAGAAVELFQSALLVHDDIMDRDQVRRGFGSVFYQYAQMADRAGIADAYHLGESLGICAGDIAARSENLALTPKSWPPAGIAA